jgi:hypothetical protein
MREFCRNVENRQDDAKDLIPHRFHLRKHDKDLVADKRAMIIERQRTIAAKIMENFKEHGDKDLFWTTSMHDFRQLIAFEDWFDEFRASEVYGEDAEDIVYFQKRSGFYRGGDDG